MFILSAQSKTRSEDYYATCSQLGTSLMAKIHHAALKREASQCITRLAPINPRGLENQEAAWVRERCRGKRYYLLHERQRMDPVASSAKKALASRFYQLLVQAQSAVVFTREEAGSGSRWRVSDMAVQRASCDERGQRIWGRVLSVLPGC
jgi:hypothetical protein